MQTIEQIGPLIKNGVAVSMDPNFLVIVNLSLNSCMAMLSGKKIDMQGHNNIYRHVFGSYLRASRLREFASNGT